MFQDAVSLVAECRDSLNLAKDAINFIRESPKRMNCFIAIQTDSNMSLRPVCPTRWTMRVSSVESMMQNYDSLVALFTEMSEGSDCTGEARSKANGYLKQFMAFDTFSGLSLILQIFSRTELVAKKLQSPSLSLSDADQLIGSLRLLWQQQREETNFDQFWTKVTSEAASLSLEKPTLPRVHRPPRRLDSGDAPHMFASPKERFRQVYFQAIDACVAAIDKRFKSVAYRLAHDIEEQLVNAANKKSFDITHIVEHFTDDLDSNQLHRHLLDIGDIINYIPTKTDEERMMPIIQRKPATISDLILLFNDNPTWSTIFPQVKRLISLFLCIPVTTCTAERSFSSLRRLKTFLRSTMTQQRLNHLTLLHVHKDITDNLDLKNICNDFISANEHRRNAFAVFN
jgi:hypothetical protein